MICGSSIYLIMPCVTESVTNDDIVRITNNMLSSPPCLAALGDVSNTPSLADVQTALHSKDGKLPRLFRLFGR